ncbi:MAG TPA: hypothetical protein VJB35_02595 [Candidatus Nanoarchaeia archaeon]|nr:hypothetical protein [Candidatus Nanoarchaeia archaeon]
MVKSNQMDASNLLKIMGVSFDYYNNFSIPKKSLSYPRLNPCEIFNSQRFIYNFNEDVVGVKTGDYKSGEIWKDNTSDVIYLYVGKDSKGKDVIIDLGGRYSYTGLIERCIVNSLKEQDGNIYFDEKIFPLD